jgi:Fic family protein
MNPYQPPFTPTPAMFSHVAGIVELLERWSGGASVSLSPQLRRENRIRTIQASLAIENNTLSVEQVTAVLDGKHVLGLPREIQEVRNAFTAYDAIPTWQPSSLEDLLAAHRLLMRGLVDNAGNWRTGGVGIYRGEQLVHMPPPASRVPALMHDLLAWLGSTDLHPLLASAVFHYEFEFIHPFEDGNGRMGRLWQTLILSRWRPVLAYLPVETVVRARQDAYYAALSSADHESECSPFVAYMLEALQGALTEAVASSGSSSEKSAEKSSEKILALLRANPALAAREVALRLAMSPRGVEKQIAALREAGRLRRVGAAKGGYWEVLN